jgi:hypothetical protein
MLFRCVFRVRYLETNVISEPFASNGSFSGSTMPQYYLPFYAYHPTGLFLSDFPTVCRHDFISQSFMLHLRSISISIRSCINGYTVSSGMQNFIVVPITQEEKRTKYCCILDSELFESPDMRTVTSI